MQCVVQFIVILSMLLDVTVGEVIIHRGRCVVKNGEVRGKCKELSECPDKNVQLDRDAYKCKSRNDLVCCPEVSESVEHINELVRSQLPTNCGYFLWDKIFYGENTHIEEFPWMALLRFSNDNGEYKNLCGGSLIGDRWVITAAHCVQDKSQTTGLRLSHVRLGEWNISSVEDCEYGIQGKPKCAPPHMDVPVDRIFLHDDYNPNTSNHPNDIALLRLKYKIEFNEFIKPICLPEANDLDDHQYEGHVMEIAGWGITEKDNNGSPLKLKTRLRVDSQRNCGRYINSLSGKQLCAKGFASSTSCHGDSGGPLIMEHNSGENNYLVGIISLGTRDCSRSGSVVFTKVENYVEWIIRKIGQNL